MLNAISDGCQAPLAAGLNEMGKKQQTCLAEQADTLPLMETFKNRMKRIRLRAGLTSQAGAAVAIGCKRGTVGMWEAPSSNVQALSSDWLFSVAKTYKVRPEWINNLRSADDGYPWQPGVAERPAGNATEAPVLRSESQVARPDPAILHESLTLLAFSEEQGGPFTDRARSAELLRLYDWCASEGGRLSDESNSAFEASVWARRNRLGGADERHDEIPAAKPGKRGRAR